MPKPRGRELLLCVWALFVCTGIVWLWTDRWTTPSIPLTRDLPRETALKSEAFDSRIKARFPLGTPENDVERELQAEKFKNPGWTPRDGQEHVAERYDGGAPVCNLVARVFWKLGDDRRLTAMRGTYHVICL